MPTLVLLLLLSALYITYTTQVTYMLTLMPMKYNFDDDRIGADDADDWDSWGAVESHFGIAGLANNASLTAAVGLGTFAHSTDTAPTPPLAHADKH